MNFLLAEEGTDDERKAKQELVDEYKKLDQALGKVPAHCAHAVTCCTTLCTG